LVRCSMGINIPTIGAELPSWLLAIFGISDCERPLWPKADDYLQRSNHR
jgi:hypothetical protein